MKKSLVLLLFMLIPSLLFADTIKLKSGNTVDGKIVQETEDYIKVDVQGVELTYYRDEIEDGKHESAISEAAIFSDLMDSNRKQKTFDKISLNTLNLQNTEVPTEIILKKIKEKTTQNINLIFDYEYESFSGDGRHDEEEGKVYVKNQDVWHQETQSEYGGKEIKIRNGSDIWRIENVKFVYKKTSRGVFDKAPSISPEFSTWRNKETMDFNIFYINPIGIEKMKYIGEENIDGEPCFVLEEEEDYYQIILWIRKDNNTLKKYIMIQNSAVDPKNAKLQTETSWSVNVKKIGLINDVKFNQDLNEDLFQYTLKEGDHAEEESEVNGKIVKKEWIVPYETASLSEQEVLQKNKELNEVFKKYTQIENFVCTYKYYKKDEKGAKIGPALQHGEEFDPFTMEDNLITPEKTQIGILKFRKPSQLSYIYDVKSSMDYENTNGSFVITNGDDLWDYSMPARFSQDSEPIKSVNKQKVKDIQSLFGEMMLSSDKFRKRSERFQDPNNPGLIAPPEMKSHELVSGSHFINLPAFVLEPFKNIDKNLIKFQGEEEIRGEKTYRFQVKESPENRKSVHWIGIKDGIARQIHEYDWVGDLVAIQMELTDVKVNSELKEDDFIFKNDGTFQIQDMSQLMPDMSKMLKQSFDTPPKDTFTRNFETPLEDVKNLKGSGMFFRGGEAFIRFNCSEDVILKDSPNYVETTEEITETADYFIKSFPEDEELLKNLDDLKLKKYVVESEPGKHSEEGRILLENKKENAYFFRMWIWSD